MLWGGSPQGSVICICWHGYSYEETGKLPASVGLTVLLKVIIALKTILHYFQCSDFTVPYIYTKKVTE